MSAPKLTKLPGGGRAGYINPLVHVQVADPEDPYCGCHEDPKALCPRWREYGITDAQREQALAGAEKALAALFPAAAPADITEQTDPEPVQCCDDASTCPTPYMHCTCRHYGDVGDGSPAHTDSDGCVIHDLPVTGLLVGETDPTDEPF